MNLFAAIGLILVIAVVTMLIVRSRAGAHGSSDSRHGSGDSGSSHGFFGADDGGGDGGGGGGD